jgi:hypothetical protein
MKPKKRTKAKLKNSEKVIGGFMEERFLNQTKLRRLKKALNKRITAKRNENTR